MEAKMENGSRKFRGRAAIVNLLHQQAQSGQSIKAFCAGQGIATGTFHNWKHKYRLQEASGFATLKIVPESGLFAIVGDIRIYQPVSAAYLKELLS